MTFHERLSQLLAVPGEEKYAMTAWSSVLLLLISWGDHPDQSVEKWEHLGKMFEICKLALNSKSLAAKTAAIQAWTTPIYIWTARPFASYRPEVLRRHLMVLIHPFKLLVGCSPVLRKALSSAFYALLLAASRTSTETQQLDILWDHVVLPVLRLYQKSTVESTRAVATEIALYLLQAASTPSTPSPGGSSSNSNNSGPFGSTTKPPRNAGRNRILQSALVQLDEVPPLPNRWIRLRSSKVLSLIESRLEDDTAGWEDVAPMWQEVLRNAKTAMQREIHTTVDTMEHVAAVCNFVRRVWRKNLVSEADVQLIIVSAIDNAGIQPFMDQVLAVVADDDNKDVALLPSFKTKKRSDDSTKGKSAVMLIIEELVDKQAPRAVSGPLLAGIVSLVRQKLKPEKRQEFLAQCVVLFGNDRDIWGALFTVTVTQSFSLPSADWDDLGWQSLNWVINKSGDPYVYLLWMAVGENTIGKSTNNRSKLAPYETRRIELIMTAMRDCKAKVREFDLGFVEGFSKTMFARAASVAQILRCLELFDGIPDATQVFSQVFEDVVFDANRVYDFARCHSLNSMDSALSKEFNNPLVRQVAVQWLERWSNRQYTGKLEYDFNKMLMSCLKCVLDHAAASDSTENIGLLVKALKFTLTADSPTLASFVRTSWNGKLLPQMKDANAPTAMIDGIVDEVGTATGIYSLSDYLTGLVPITTSISPARAKSSFGRGMAHEDDFDEAPTSPIVSRARRARSRASYAEEVTSPAENLGRRRSRRLERRVRDDSPSPVVEESVEDEEPSESMDMDDVSERLELDTQPDVLIGSEDVDVLEDAPLTPADEFDEVPEVAREATPIIETASVLKETPVTPETAAEGTLITPDTSEDRSEDVQQPVAATGEAPETQPVNQEPMSLAETQPVYQEPVPPPAETQPVNQDAMQEVAETQNAYEEDDARPNSEPTAPLSPVQTKAAKVSKKRKGRKKKGRKAKTISGAASSSASGSSLESTPELAASNDDSVVDESQDALAEMAPALSDTSLEEKLKSLQEFESKNPVVRELERRCLTRSYTTGASLLDSLSDDLLSSLDEGARKRIEEFRSRASESALVDANQDDRSSKRRKRGRPRKLDLLENDNLPRPKKNKIEPVTDMELPLSPEPSSSREPSPTREPSPPTSPTTLNGGDTQVVNFASKRLFVDDIHADIQPEANQVLASVDAAKDDEPISGPATPEADVEADGPVASTEKAAPASPELPNPQSQTAALIAEMDEISSSPPALDDFEPEPAHQSLVKPKQPVTVKQVLEQLSSIDWDDAQVLADLSSQECFELEGILMKAMMQTRRAQIASGGR